MGWQTGSAPELGTLAFPRAGEMSRKPTSGGNETMGWQMGWAVDRRPAKGRWFQG
jgi:hypothetical protein